MPTKPGGYFVAGKQVPSVTTILSRWKEAAGLIHWAWKLGAGGQDYREVRDNAAGIGTVAHKMVEIHLEGYDFTCDDSRLPRSSPEDYEKSWAAFNSYLSWERHTKLKMIDRELGMVSTKHLFGGTLDATAEIDGELCLIDFKTSNSIYSDYLYQLAAYMNLYNENNFLPITGGAHLLKFSKDSGDFHHHYYQNLDEAWEGFLLMRRLYDIDKVLKNRVK